MLHVLAATRGRTRVGEIGTGVGIGAAWIVSALEPTVPFVTVELDAERAAAAEPAVAPGICEVAEAGEAVAVP